MIYSHVAAPGISPKKYRQQNWKLFRYIRDELYSSKREKKERKRERKIHDGMLLMNLRNHRDVEIQSQPILKLKCIICNINTDTAKSMIHHLRGKKHNETSHTKNENRNNRNTLHIHQQQPQQLRSINVSNVSIPPTSISNTTTSAVYTQHAISPHNINGNKNRNNMNKRNYIVIEDDDDENDNKYNKNDNNVRKKKRRLNEMLYEEFENMEILKTPKRMRLNDGSAQIIDNKENGINENQTQHRLYAHHCSKSELMGMFE